MTEKKPTHFYLISLIVVKRHSKETVLPATVPTAQMIAVIGISSAQWSGSKMGPASHDSWPFLTSASLQLSQWPILGAQSLRSDHFSSIIFFNFLHEKCFPFASRVPFPNRSVKGECGPISSPRTSNHECRKQRCQMFFYISFNEGALPPRTPSHSSTKLSIGLP